MSEEIATIEQQQLDDTLDRLAELIANGADNEMLSDYLKLDINTIVNEILPDPQVKHAVAKFKLSLKNQYNQRLAVYNEDHIKELREIFNNRLLDMKVRLEASRTLASITIPLMTAAEKAKQQSAGGQANNIQINLSTFDVDAQGNVTRIPRKILGS